MAGKITDARKEQLKILLGRLESIEKEMEQVAEDMATIRSLIDEVSEEILTSTAYEAKYKRRKAGHKMTLKEELEVQEFALQRLEEEQAKHRKELEELKEMTE